MPATSGVTFRVREFFQRTTEEYSVGALASMMHVSYLSMHVVLKRMMAHGELRRRHGGLHPANNKVIWLYAPTRGLRRTPDTAAQINGVAPVGFDATALARVLGTVHDGAQPVGRVHRVDDPDVGGRPRKEHRA
jgi:hypothetical protein